MALAADKVIRSGVPNNGNYTIGVRAVNSMDGATFEGPVTNSNQVAPYGKPLAASINPVTVTTTVSFDVGAVVNNGRRHRRAGVPVIGREVRAPWAPEEDPSRQATGTTSPSASP